MKCREQTWVSCIPSWAVIGLVLGGCREDDDGDTGPSVADLQGTWDATWANGGVMPYTYEYEYEDEYGTVTTYETYVAMEMRLDASGSGDLESVERLTIQVGDEEPGVYSYVYQWDVETTLEDEEYVIRLSQDDAVIRLRCTLDDKSIACTDDAEAAWGFELSPSS